MAVVAATPGDAYWISDCGNKALVAKQLLETRFADASLEQAAVGSVPVERWFPIPRGFALRRGDSFVSAYPPLYSGLAAIGLSALGPHGLRLPSALGAAACSLFFVFWAGPMLGRAAATAGALVLGLATPLFFYGVTVWEHSLTVAAVVLACALLSQERVGRWASAGAAIGAACWLREELGLFALAVVAVAIVRRQSPRLVLAFAAGVAVLGAALLVFNVAYYGNPLGGHVLANLGSEAPESGPVSRFTALPGLLGGVGHGPGERWAFSLLALVLPLAGAVLPRRLRGSNSVALGLALAGLVVWGIAGWRMLSGERPLSELSAHNGLLLQWPMLVLVGLGARRLFEEPACRALHTGAVAGALFAAMVLSWGIAMPVAYGIQVGSGVHWGPRVLLPALPALVLFSLVAAHGRTSGVRAAWGALALAGVLSSVHATVFLAQQKTDGALFVERVRELEPRALVTSHSLLPQVLAALWDDKTWLLTRGAKSVLMASLALERGGEREFLQVVRAGNPSASWLPGVQCEVEFKHRGRGRYFDLDVRRCRFDSSAGERPALAPSDRG
jgi:4-amino-4-deoxy-L-arabinose transferase-like glycosyltransferase